MEPEIKRVNFFDGQFLKQAEFTDEQLYHSHMRRRMNYLLFDQSGVIQAEAGDLTIELVDANDVNNKTFRVLAGMAVAKHDDVREAKEIILRDDSPIRDLAAEGIGAGQTAWVTIHFQEQLVQDPPSEGSVQDDTRVLENGVITVHAATPPVAEPASNEPYVRLGTIAFDTMTVSADAAANQRLLAHIRGSLVAGAVAQLVSISLAPDPVDVARGATIQLTATGTFSDNSTRMLGVGDGLVWSSGDASLATVDAVTGLVSGVAIGSVAITVTAQGIPATSTVNVVAAAPSLVSITINPDPLSLDVGATISVTATGLFDDSSNRLLTPADGLSWNSSDPGIVTIDATGNANGIAIGAATITATAQGQNDNVAVTVTSPIPAPLFDPLNPFTPRSQFPNNPVSIRGQNFDVDLPAAPPQVFLGIAPGTELSATVTAATATTITITVPVGGNPNESVPVRVITSGGEVSSADLNPAVLLELNP